MEHTRCCKDNLQRKHNLAIQSPHTNQGVADQGLAVKSRVTCMLTHDKNQLCFLSHGLTTWISVIYISTWPALQLSLKISSWVTFKLYKQEIGLTINSASMLIKSHTTDHTTYQKWKSTNQIYFTYSKVKIKLLTSYEVSFTKQLKLFIEQTSPKKWAWREKIRRGFRTSHMVNKLKWFIACWLSPLVLDCQCKIYQKAKNTSRENHKQRNGPCLKNKNNKI